MFDGIPPPKIASLALLLTLAGTPRVEAASVSYTYDQLGRVTTALYDNGTCIAYTYDPSGNRTAQTNTTSGAPQTPSWGTGVWGCFSWTASRSAEPMPPDGQGLSASTAAPPDHPTRVGADSDAARMVSTQPAGAVGAP